MNEYKKYKAMRRFILNFLNPSAWTSFAIVAVLVVGGSIYFPRWVAAQERPQQLFLLSEEATLSVQEKLALEKSFFYMIVEDPRIVDIVYEKISDPSDLNLAFALMMKESNFDPHATNVNYKNGKVRSVDRGLFQLNSSSYPFLREKDFFNISINISYGIAHIEQELERFDGNIKQALWAYNAGYTKVENNTVPERTYIYAEDILRSVAYIQNEKEKYFSDYLIRKEVL